MNTKNVIILKRDDLVPGTQSLPLHDLTIRCARLTLEQAAKAETIILLDFDQTEPGRPIGCFKLLKHRFAIPT